MMNPYKFYIYIYRMYMASTFNMNVKKDIKHVTLKEICVRGVEARGYMVDEFKGRRKFFYKFAARCTKLG